MNIRDLTYISAVARLASFSKAAQACHVSQPSLSAQIRKIEADLGGALFVRDRRGVELTTLGEQLLPYIERMLDEHAAMLRLSRQNDAIHLPRMVLGAIPTLAPYLYPQLARHLSDDMPGLTLREEKTDSLLAGLVAGTVDAALIALPTDTHIFDSIPLFDDPFVIAMPATHALASTTTPIDLASLQEEKLLLLGEGHCLRQQALSICQSRHLRESRMVQGTSLETIREMVAIGEGVTLLPRIAMRADAAITYRAINTGSTGNNDNNSAYQRTIGLAWPRSRPLKAGLNQLTNMIKDAYAEKLTTLPPLPILAKRTENIT